MKITRVGSQPSAAGPETLFTGRVRIDSPFSCDEPGRHMGAVVTFDCCARTNWHRHPLGQTLIVTSGVGHVQREGGPIETIRPGDIITILPGEKHWHGAARDTAMSHIAITETLDGKNTDWLEPVTDEQYGL